MQELQELVDLSAEHRVERPTMLDPEYHTQSRSKTGQLFSLLRRRAVTNDDEAQLTLGIAGRKAYLMVKSRLRKRILNYFFFIDVHRVFGNTKVGYEFLAHRSLFSSRLLFAIGAVKNGKHFADLALRQAKKYDLTEVHVQSLQLLRSYYSELGDLEKVQVIHEELLAILSQMQTELFLENIYQRVRARYRADKEERAEILDDLEDELQFAMHNHHAENRPLTVLFHNLMRLKHALQLEHKQAMDVCEQALLTLQAMSYVFEAEATNFTLAYIRHAICAREYDDGEAFIIENLHTVKDGSEQWFLLMRYYFLLATNCGNFQEAEVLYVSATQHRLFGRIGEFEREHWRVFGALMLALSELRTKTVQLSSQTYYNKSDYEELLRLPIEENLTDSDWESHLLILRFVHGLAAGNTNRVLTTISHISSLLQKGRSSEAQKRTRMFLQMLALFDDERKAQDIIHEQQVVFSKLRELPPDYRGSIAGLEIINYESLWSTIRSTATEMLL